jgi:hypothetical protein
MKTFYRIMLALIRFEQVIARSTGRNPDNIAALASNIDEYESLLTRAEINRA